MEDSVPLLFLSVSFDDNTIVVETSGDSLTEVTFAGVGVMDGIGVC